MQNENTITHKAKIYKNEDGERSGFCCPICGKYHWHGIESGSRSPVGHCGSMLNDEEYYLEVVGDATEEDYRALEEHEILWEKNILGENFISTERKWESETEEEYEDRVNCAERKLREFCKKHNLDYDSTEKECRKIAYEDFYKLYPDAPKPISPEDIHKEIDESNRRRWGAYKEMIDEREHGEIDALKEEMAIQEKECAETKEINWRSDDFYKEDGWNKLKGRIKNILGNGEEWVEAEVKDNPTKLFFYAHTHDTIKGKPQLVEPVMRTIPLVRECKVKKSKGYGKNKIEWDERKINFFDEKLDARSIQERQTLSMDFWLYRVIDNGKEHYVYSMQELGSEVYELKGMLVEVQDFAELSRSLKIKSLSKIFFLHGAVPTIKVLPKEELVGVTKALKEQHNYGYDDFEREFYTHEDGNCYPRSNEANKLDMAQALSSNEGVDNFPLSKITWGPPGTGKTMNLECKDRIFKESILEGGNSTPKVLVPSFKEKPADIGFLAKCNRVALTDEIGKMVQNQVIKARQSSSYDSYLGDVNFLLEHKQRDVGSGNNNTVRVKATMKSEIGTNFMINRPRIYEHVGIIDDSFLSRNLNWVQDVDEVEFILGKTGIFSANTFTTILDNLWIIKNKNKNIVLDMCSRKDSESKEGEIDLFFTIYDSCQGFVSDIDDAEVLRIANTITSMAEEPMKTKVWRPRATHHTKLIIDGLCKARCLFKDFNPEFKATQEDYDMCERILIRMVNGWKTNWGISG